MEITPEQACEDLIMLLKRLKHSMAEVAELHELTAIQLHALHTISEGDITMGGLAHLMHCDASNATGIVDRLVSQKLVTREEKAHDRRAKTLVPTEKGKQIVRLVNSKLPTHLGVDKLSASERAKLHELITKLA
ncbi:MAG TPA: MarR family transcriptional regulator [Candidatus Saccharimonadales bacterium]|nr:MarR family transcriptional regulator [Candidatus Saccharimonadales bacterium]